MREMAICIKGKLYEPPDPTAENGYWPAKIYVRKPTPKPKQEACEDLECYHRLVKPIIIRDVQRGTVPEEALRKSCCWSKICEVRHLAKIGIHSPTWVELCRRRETILYRKGRIPPLVVREPLFEALDNARRQPGTETKGDLNAKLAVKELTR